MEEIAVIEQLKSIIVLISTPLSVGTGFFVPEWGLIVTNEHLVKSNRRVAYKNDQSPNKYYAEVVLLDEKSDIAFLKPEGEIPKVDVRFLPIERIKQGHEIVALGYPFELEYSATKGIVSNVKSVRNRITHIQHDASLNPGNSGGPLIDLEGRILGMNSFVLANANNICFSIAVNYLLESYTAYKESEAAYVLKCKGCINYIYEEAEFDLGICSKCGSKFSMGSMDNYLPVGISKSIEDILLDLEFDPFLARQGVNQWEIYQGSATINISYFGKNGLIIGDAILCKLPKENIESVYNFLLRENFSSKGLTFSVKGQEIILSVIIHDKYFNFEIGKKIILHLCQNADKYDNILVEKYGADWE